MDPPRPAFFKKPGSGGGLSPRFFLLALLLSGCDLAPPYKLPLVATPVSYKEAGAWTRSAPADDRPRGDWWTVFDDPTLSDLEGRLNGANPTLAAATAAFERARALSTEAAAGLFPYIGVGGHINTDRQSARRPLRTPRQPNQYLDNALDVQATYEIDLWDRVANSIKAGRAAAQATQADLETTRLSLHAELATDYLTLRGLDARIALLRNTDATYTRALELTQNRLAGHIASGIDVSRAATQLDTARAETFDVIGRRALVEHAIALLLGEAPAFFSLPSNGRLPAVPVLSAGLPSALLQRRPDVAAAERQMAAANAEIGVARAAFYPNITLNAVLGLADSGFDLFTLRDSFWAVGPGLALPLFEGGLRRAQEAAAIAAWQITSANYRETVLDAFADVEDQAALLHWLGLEQGSENAAATDAGHTLDVALNLYKEGVSSYLDVVTAQTAELDAERASLELTIRRMATSVALIRALGGGWDRSELTGPP